MKFATKAIHSSYDCDEHNRALMPPIYQNSMFALHEIGENVSYARAIPLSPSPIFTEALMIYWSMFIKNGG